MVDKIKELQQDPSYQQCVRCVMDTTDPNIEFDENGFRNHCRGYFDKWSAITNLRPIENVWQEIKDKSSGEYDAVLGVSGGADSCWLAYLAKEAGLNILLVHADDGFNTAAATKNVEMTAKHTGYDIEYYTIPADEMIDIIRSYF